MKKLFKLQIEGKNSDRLLDAFKHEVRKYVKRERRKILPNGADYWEFDCKFGATAELAEPVHLGEITKNMSHLAQAGAEGFYVEIIALPAVRKPREATAVPSIDNEEDLSK